MPRFTCSRSALSGNGGYCIENPKYQPAAIVSRKVRQY